jgi:hypothetical protein
VKKKVIKLDSLATDLPSPFANLEREEPTAKHQFLTPDGIIVPLPVAAAQELVLPAEDQS